MSNKVIIKPILCNCCNITLPYIINTESPNKRIGIFGDSFAALQDEITYSKVHLNDNLWSHEFSWMYYLGMLTNFNNFFENTLNHPPPNFIGFIVLT